MVSEAHPHQQPHQASATVPPTVNGEAAGPGPVDPEAGGGGSMWGPTAPRAASPGKNETRLNEVDALLSTAKRLHRNQRDRLEALEAEWALARFKMGQAFQARMQALEREAEEAMREHDEVYAVRRADCERLIAALGQLRDA